MKNDDFLKLCKKIVKNHANVQINEDNIFVVWSCKALQNNKALLSTTLFDGMYYELTFNGDKKELYLDAYKKFENTAIKIEEE